MASLDVKQIRIALPVCLYFGIIIQLPSLGYSQAAKVDKDLEAVQDDWQARQKIMKSVRYVLKGSTEFRDANLPPGNPIQPREGRLLLDLVKHRYCYHESQGVINVMGQGSDQNDKWQYTQRTHSMSFDGIRSYSYTNRKLNGITEDVEDLTIGEGKMPRNNAFNEMLHPIFFAHGYGCTIYQPLTIDDWPSKLDPEEIRNRGRQPFDGFNLLVFTTEPMANSAQDLKEGGRYDEIWINTERQSAIQQYIYYSRGNPRRHLNITWKETPNGWWVDEWTNTKSVNNNVQRIYRYQIESMEVNPPISDTDFVLPAEPGMKVVVGGYADIAGISQNPLKQTPHKVYRVSPTGSLVELSTEGVPISLTRSWWFWLWTTFVLGLLALLVFGILKQKRRIAH